MKEPDLEEERLLASARGLKVTLERRTLEDQVAPVTISAPGGERSDVTLERDKPGVWKATFDVKLRNILAREALPDLLLITNRCQYRTRLFSDQVDVDTGVQQQDHQKTQSRFGAAVDDGRRQESRR